MTDLTVRDRFAPSQTDAGTTGMERARIMTKYPPGRIVEMLRQAEIELAKGRTIRDVCESMMISELTYYRWRQKYGGISPELIRELEVLHKDNRRLRRLIADRRRGTGTQQQAGEDQHENS